jgi:hypothetical protein
MNVKLKWLYLSMTIVVTSGLFLAPVELRADPEATKKWFPGHYVYADSNDKAFAGGIQDLPRSLVKNNPNFRGYHVRYSWANLEPAKGRYDFSAVLRDLQTAASDNKKLIVHIHDRNWQRNERIPIPTYMLTDPVYEGGMYEAIDSQSGQFVTMPKKWVPAYTQRFQALILALGAAIDRNPYLAYVATEEAHLPGATTQSGFTSAKLRDHYIAVYTTAAAAFPTTIFSQWGNWRGGLTSADLSEMFRHLVEVTKNGFGGPDALNDKRSLDNAFGPFYRKYRGIAPITMSSQASSYKQNDAKTVLDYSVDALGAHFHSWVPIMGAVHDTAFTFNDVITEVNRQGGRINTQVPSILQQAAGGGGVGLPAPSGVRLIEP